MCKACVAERLAGLPASEEASVGEESIKKEEIEKIARPRSALYHLDKRT
jgi:hypothetical protein